MVGHALTYTYARARLRYLNLFKYSNRAGYTVQVGVLSARSELPSSSTGKAPIRDSCSPRLWCGMVGFFSFLASSFFSCKNLD